MIIKYTNANTSQRPKNKNILVLELGLTLIVNALVILMAASIFEGMIVASPLYAVITALVIMILNKTIKPIINILALPLTLFTLGLFYPFVNVIILKLTSFIMGDAFIITGWFVPFFIAIFISFMTILLDIMITKRIIGGIK